VKRLPLIIAGVLALVGLGILSSIVTQGFHDLARAEEEHRQYSEEKARLERSIEDLRETLDAVRTDPAAVESLARHDLGWVRPGEQVLLLATPTPPAPPADEPGPEATPVLTLPD
jgi:cell division protein FtsB